MCCITKGNQFLEAKLRKLHDQILRKHGRLVQGHDRKLVIWTWAPVDNAPALGCSEVNGNSSKCLVMAFIWCCGEPRQEGYSRTDVYPTEGIGIDELP